MLDNHGVSIDEFAYNVALCLVGACDRCMQLCIDEFTDSNAECMVEYCERFLVPVDFMPNPDVFIAGSGSTDEIESMKLQLKPKYMRLYQLTRNRMNRTRSAN
jgi:hypothetical protein